MSNVKRDNNQVPCISGVLNTDGATVTPIKADASTHILDVSAGSTGSDNGGTKAVHDANDERTLLAASSSDETPVCLYVNSSGALLIKTT